MKWKEKISTWSLYWRFEIILVISSFITGLISWNIYMSIKKVILDALEKKYEAEISAAEATIKIYLENSVGIGEHPQHIEEVDKLIDKIAQAEEKLKILKSFQ